MNKFHGSAVIPDNSVSITTEKAPNCKEMIEPKIEAIIKFFLDNFLLIIGLNINIEEIKQP